MASYREILMTETPLQTMGQLRHAATNLQQLVAELSASLWDKATDQERRFPDQRVPIIQEEPFPVVPEADRATTNYTPAYIDNTHGVLDVEGYVPKEAILDTGATKVMLSQTFAAAMQINSNNLTRGVEYVTASGFVEMPLGVSPKHEITHWLASREHPQSDGLAERMVQTMKRALRKCLLDGGGEEWDELLPYVAMGYQMSKQKAVGYSPYFLMFGWDPIIQSRLQESQAEVLDLETSEEGLRAFLDLRGHAVKRVMPLAMRNLSIAQQRDMERYSMYRSMCKHSM